MNAHRAFKNELFEQFARIGKALANTSRHLQVLRTARLVEVRREGLYAYYQLADEQVFVAWQGIRNLGEARLAEIDLIVQTFLKIRESLEAVDAEVLLARLQDESVIILDVRPEEEYRAGHIPSARSVPVERLEAYLEEIPKNREIIAYCRGPYCVFSDEAVALLRSRGYQARRLAQGLPDWRAAGEAGQKREGPKR